VLFAAGAQFGVPLDELDAVDRRVLGSSAAPALFEQVLIVNAQVAVRRAGRVARGASCLSRVDGQRYFLDGRVLEVAEDRRSARDCASLPRPTATSGL
jgi:hypothetical protein